MWVTGTYDPDTNQTIWGTGNPVPMFDPTYRPGDNLFTNSAISWDPDTGKMNWYFQYTPGDMWDYDEVGTHILIDGEVAGQPRKLITHSAATASSIPWTAFNGQTVLAKPYMEVNWTKGIDQKTGKPLDYDPSKDIQTYSGVANQTPDEPLKKVCPSIAGGNNYWPSSYSREDQAPLHSGTTANCVDVTIDTEKHTKEKGWNGGSATRPTERYESNLTAVDPVTGEIKKTVHLRYPNYSGTLATGGGLVFLALHDGTVAAFDDTTLDELWKINVGSGFSAPPMTFEVNGKQYVAIVSGPSPPREAAARQHAGTQGAAQRDRALCVRAVSGESAATPAAATDITGQEPHLDQALSAVSMNEKQRKGRHMTSRIRSSAPRCSPAAC